MCASNSCQCNIIQLAIPLLLYSPTQSLSLAENLYGMAQQ